MKPFLCTLLLFAVASAQPKSTEELFEMDLESLLNIKVEVATASKKGTAISEAPGIVTVLTREELLTLGARDLFDALLLVPGLDFGVDVWSLVGLGVRGNWASEGKALLLIDGVEMNEQLYGTLQFINHYRLENVERIEIIRGPGSALYGGTAELAVINVISRDGAAVNGVNAQASVSLMDENFGGAGGHLTWGGKIGQTTVSLAGGYEYRNRSTREYTNLYEESYSLLENGAMQSIHANLGIRWKGLGIRAIADRYSQLEQDGYAYIYSEPAVVSYDTYVLKADYAFDLSENASLTPWVSGMYQRPWYEGMSDDTTGNQAPYTKWTGTVRGGLALSWDLSEKVNIAAGLEAKYDYAGSDLIADYGDDEYFQFYDGSYSYAQGLVAGYAQALFTPSWLNITAGFRGQYSPDFGWAIAPRGVIGKDFGKFHFKLLASGAYKSPTIENVNANKNAQLAGLDVDDIQAEQTFVAELEAGVKLTKNMSLTANAFHIRMDDPIVYFYEYQDDTTYIDGYKNFDRTGTQGFEIEYRTKFPLWWARLSYSWQRAYKNDVAYYTSPDNDDAMTGWPSHKAVLAGGVTLLDKRLSIGPTVVFTSSRFAFTGVEYDTTDPSGETYWTTGTDLDPLVLINLNLAYDFPFGLRVALGAYNLLDDPMLLAQPYDGEHGPMSSSSRTFRLTLGYEMKGKGR